MSLKLRMGTGYRDWFNEKNRITHGNLKRVAKLLKYLRDSKGRFSVKSILLTTVIGNAIDGDDDDLKSVPDALRRCYLRRWRPVWTSSWTAS